MALSSEACGQARINPLTGDLYDVVIASRPIFNSRIPPCAPGRGTPGSDGEAERDYDLWDTTTQEFDWLQQFKDDGKRRAARRAKKRVYEICACTDFDLFFTLTIDPADLNSFDYHAAVAKLMIYLQNRVRRRGLRYICVPELHKSGRIHFHGLCNMEAMRLEPAYKRDSNGDLVLDKRGHKIRLMTQSRKPLWNITDWPWFTTAAMLDGNREAVAHYVAKYVVKELEAAEGPITGRYYYHGGDTQGFIKRPFLPDREAVITKPGFTVEIKEAGLTLNYYRGDAALEMMKGGIFDDSQIADRLAETLQ